MTITKSLILVIGFTLLSGCGSWEYAITKVELSAKARTCTFDVEFPDDYTGGERGKQTLTVTPMTAEEVAFRHVGPTSYEVGKRLRYKCAEYLGGS